MRSAEGSYVGKWFTGLSLGAGTVSESGRYRVHVELTYYDVTKHQRCTHQSRLSKGRKEVGYILVVFRLALVVGVHKMPWYFRTAGGANPAKLVLVFYERVILFQLVFNERNLSRIFFCTLPALLQARGEPLTTRQHRRYPTRMDRRLSGQTGQNNNKKHVGD